MNSLIGRGGAALIAGVGLLVALVSASPVASAASTLHFNDTGNLSYYGSSGGSFLERGTGTGTVRCTIKLSGKVVGKKFIATVTASNGSGSVTGTSTASVTSQGSSVDKFSGSFKATSGTGKWAHISGTGQLAGSVNTNTYATSVHITGTFRY
jgi:hypothetical protein